MIEVHASAQVILHIGETIGQCERQLRNRIGTSFGNVVATYGNAVKITNGAFNEGLLNISHQAQCKFRRENARILSLVFFKYVRLHRSTNLSKGFGFELFIDVSWQHFIASASEDHEAKAIVSFGQFTLVLWTLHALRFPLGMQDFFYIIFHPVFENVFLATLICCGIEEKGEQNGSGPIDCHGNTGSRITKIKSTVELFRIINGANAHAAVADFSKDIRTSSGITSIKSDTIKCRGKPLCRHPVRDIVKALVCALGSSFTRKHPSRIFSFSFEWINAGRIWKVTREILLQRPTY